MRKVEVVVDEGISAAFPGKWSCPVEVDSESGARAAQGVEAARGDPPNPMGPDDVRAKVHALTGSLVEREARERISDVVEHLDREPDAARLAAMLRAARRGSAHRRRERVRR
jgi:2-methylcitrate dehydratase PrpD